MQSSVASLRITRGRNVIVDQEALANFVQLQNIFITGVETLTFRHNSLHPIKAQKAISLTVDLQRTGIATLDPGALSDWRNPGSKILLKNLKQLTITKQALAPNSTFKDVMIENVQSLYMQGESVQASIGYLELRNVSLVCMSNTFTGSVRRMALASVTSNSMKKGCIKADKPGWKSLSLRSSYINHVEDSAIQGKIEDVEIENCRFEDVKPKGLHLDVSRFSLSSCEIGKLKGNALQVRANLSISLHSLHVDALYGDALVDLKITRSDGYRSPDGQRPQVCLSAFTANAAADGALRFDSDSPVSLFGRVCPAGVDPVQDRAKCIGADSEALVSRDVFQARCCFDGVGAPSPVCPTFDWVPYVAAAAVGVLLVIVALLCYWRKLRSKRWQVARRVGHPRVSIVPSVEGLGSDTSDMGSPDRVLQAYEYGKQSDSRDNDDVFAGTDGRVATLNSGPLASWLQTLRQTMSPRPECGSAETIEMVESGTSEKRRAPGETMLPGGACAGHETGHTDAEAGSDTASVLHKDPTFSESKTSEEVKQQTTFGVQPPEDNQETEIDAHDTSYAESRHWNEDQETQDRSKKKKKKLAPTRPSGALTAGAIQRAESEQPLPVYAQVTKRTKPLQDGQQSRRVSSSVEVLMDSASSPRNSPDSDGEATRSGRMAAFEGKATTIGPRQSDVVYADVFNSLPRAPNFDPAARPRRRSLVDSSCYADVYHTLDTARARDSGPGAASQCSEYDDTYDDVVTSARSNQPDSRGWPGTSASDARPLIRCPLYSEGHEEPNPMRGGPGADATRRTRRSPEYSLYAEVRDEEPVAGECRPRPVPRGRFMYVEKSERDHSGGGSGVTARTSYLYAEITDFSPPAKQDKVLLKTTPESKDREVPSYANVHKNTRDGKSRNGSKTGDWFRQFSGKGTRDKSAKGDRRWPKK